MEHRPPSDRDSPPPQGHGRWWRRAAMAGVAALVWSVLFRFVTIEAVIDAYAAFSRLVLGHMLAAALIFILLYVAVVALTLPVSVGLTVIGGAVFSPLLGVPLTVISGTIGASLAFLAARGLFHDVLMRRAGPWLKLVHREFHADAASYILLLRLTPLIPFVIVNVIVALLGAPLRTFIWTTLLGMLPGTTTFSFLGAGLKDVLDGEVRRIAMCRAAGQAPCPSTLSFDSLMTPNILMGLAALAGLVLISIVARRRLAGRTAVPASAVDDCG